MKVDGKKKLSRLIMNLITENTFTRHVLEGIHAFIYKMGFNMSALLKADEINSTFLNTISATGYGLH